MTGLLWRANDGSCVVEVPQSIIDEMVARADGAHPLETGASLFGHYSDDQRTVCLDGVAPTPEDAERSPCEFRRGSEGLAEFMERLFVETGGTQYYIGEFHSHPGGAPIPSADDDAAQLSIAIDPESQCAAPILVIVAGEPGARQLGVYVYTSQWTRWSLVPAEAE